MIALYELIQLLPASFEAPFRNRLNELYLFLRQHPGLSEKEAAQHFLEGNDKHFNKLKNQLKEAICAYLITQPANWADNDQKQTFDTALKQFTVSKILLAASRRKAGIERALAVLKKLEYLEAHALIYSVAIDLQFHFSSIDPNAKLARYYAKVVEQQTEFIRIESEVRLAYSRIGLLCNKRNSYPPSIVIEVEAIAKKCEGYSNVASTPIRRFVHTIQAIRYIISYDYEHTIQQCNAALRAFDRSYANYNAICFDFISKQIPALLATGQLKKAKEMAKKAGQMMPKGQFNWQYALLCRVIVCFHQGQYQEAYDLAKAKGKATPSYPILAEQWKIIKGYMHFLILTGHIEPYREERFPLGKFMNEVPIASQDKTGSNINILLVQILIQMYRGEYGKIIDRIDALRDYVRTYTRNPETIRANLFLTMILKMEAASFHRAGTERKTGRLLKKLMQTPIALSQNIGVEIIPYPVLWQMMLTLLENKFRTPKTRRSKTSMS